jgi:uncharacterized membrane protein (Fun14 family)
MKEFKDRLINKGTVTTVIGLGFIIGAVAAWFFKYPIEEVVLIAGYGLMFLRSKDSLIGIKEK